MQNKQYMLLINRQSNAFLVKFPALIELPQSKTVNDVKYIRTDRKKTTSGVQARIYLEVNSDLDVNEFADDEVASEEDNLPPAMKIAEQFSARPIQPETIDVNSAPASDLPETTIYGTSDDLIEFEGAYTGEVSCYMGNEEDSKGALIIISDGTLLQVKYGKADEAIWAITVLKKGTAYSGFEPCDDPDADIYSDIVTLRGDIKWAYCSLDWDKVE